MAKVEKVVRDCDRCAKPTPAEGEPQRFSVGRDQYELDLCAAHRQSFHRDLSAWTRNAREITPVVHDFKTEARREREADRAASVSSVFIKPPADGTVVVQKLPPKFNLWTLSEHAKERCGQRGIAERDALLCAADPGVAYPTREEPGEWFHFRGPLTTVVNPTLHTVITVLWNDKQEREAAGR